MATLLLLGASASCVRSSLAPGDSPGDSRVLPTEPQTPTAPSGLAMPGSPEPPAEPPAPAASTPTPAPAHLTNAELRRLARSDPAALGSLSFGTPNAGSLQNGQKLVDGPLWNITSPETTWATEETARYLTRALEVARKAGVGKVYLGEISAEWGGKLNPHKSHQSGRDVDIGYPRLDDRWWEDATSATLDTTNAWRLIRALVTETDVEVIFVDRAVARQLASHALRLGEDGAWVRGLFDLDHSERPLIRHEAEHKNHLHVRFFNPEAQRRAAVVHDLLGRGVPRAQAPVLPARRLPPPG